MTADTRELHPLDQLAEEFVARLRRGERPSVEDYVRDHPELEADIRELFPVLQMMEQPPASEASATENVRGDRYPTNSMPAAAPRDYSTLAGDRPRGTAICPPAPGDRLDDFDLIRLLGSGSFARVFLAKQVSLGRWVALKVSARRGGEARTLAILEHDHIVRVFSEAELPERNLHLLCMQYVPGTTLESILTALGQRPRAEWSGQAILDVLDRISTDAAPLDVAALRDRELLAGLDYVEAVCWMGARIAEALAHAHAQGVLHRDVKPANVLVNRYGRPMLADFNIALEPDLGPGGAGSSFGGTLAYMAPEHLDAFNPHDQTAPEVVDERSDLYSWGVVLYRMLTGRYPFVEDAKPGQMAQSLWRMAAERRSGPQPIALDETAAPPALGQTIRRCLEADPARRYQTGAALAAALDGCRELRHICRELPEPDPFTRFTIRRPFLMMVLLTLGPHFVGSVVNTTYNQIRIVGPLPEPVRNTFWNVLVPTYNVVVYPAALLWFYLLAAPLYRGWRRLQEPTPPDSAQVRALRRHALAMPVWAGVIACLGWLPGGLLFPLGLDCWATRMTPDVYGHFLISFTISGLIALTYSVLGMQFVVLRALYPRLWADATGVRQEARQELKATASRLGILQLLAGLIPLAGAVLMIEMDPEQFQHSDDGYRHFRWLVTGLIGLGMVGFGAAMLTASRIGLVLTAFQRGFTTESQRTQR